MSDLDDALANTTPEPVTSVSTATPRRCRRHSWTTWSTDPERGGDLVVPAYCYRCGQPKDEDRSRRGKSAARFGKDQERRIERVYGPRKVGEFGSPVDLLGATFKWQSKATRSQPAAWLALISGPTLVDASQFVRDAAIHMDGDHDYLYPLVIVTHVWKHQTRDWLYVPEGAWRAIHWWPTDGDDWVVMSGDQFLAIHGRDSEHREAA